MNETTKITFVKLQIIEQKQGYIPNTGYEKNVMSMNTLMSFGCNQKTNDSTD